MEHLLPTGEFLNAVSDRVLLDVRSPGEYAHGHIPGAVSFPLFSDEERARVGTTYKQEGHDAAVLLGLRLVGPKLADYVEKATALAPDHRVALHCWRGGQRSGSMAWLLQQAGFNVTVMTGGYKQYRRHVLETFGQQSWPLIVVGGRTGTGKTHILHALRAKGEQVLDLEGLANHKGSAFGAIGEQPQPTVEQFENNMYQVLSEMDIQKRIWVENESKSIGRIYIPDPFWAHMKRAPLFNIEIPQEERLENLIKDYTTYDIAELEAAFLRIERKLGGQHLKAALDALQQNDARAAAGIALHYYDKTYQHGLETSTAAHIRMLKFEHNDREQIATACMQSADELGLMA